jgi:aminopeptidase C
MVLSGTRLDGRIIRVELDAGFQPGRQYMDVVSVVDKFGMIYKNVFNSNNNNNNSLVNVDMGKAIRCIQHHSKEAAVIIHSYRPTIGWYD